MENHTVRTQEAEIKIVWIIKALLCAFVLSAFLLMLLAMLLYKMNLDEKKVAAEIVVIYVLSTFLGGFFIGKKAGKRKFIWGLIVGILYFALLLLISFGIYHSLQANGANVLATFLMCAGGGTLGGMFS